MNLKGKSFRVVLLFVLSAITQATLHSQPVNYQPYVFSSFAGPSTIATVDGTNSDARFYFPQATALDSAGNVYVTEASTVRKVSSAGVVTTIAGAPGIFGTNDGTTADALFNTPVGVVVDSSNNVFVADSQNNTIRKITTNGIVTTFAGQPRSSTRYQDGQGTAARFYIPMGLAIDSANNIYVADQNNNSIRLISRDGTVTLFAGSGSLTSSGSTDGSLFSARFSSPVGVAVGSNLVFVADTGNNTIRKINIGASTVSTLAGLPGTSGSTDGTGTAARFRVPRAIAVDRSTNVFVAEYGNHLIRKVTPAGVVTTIAGSAATVGNVNGATNNALFNIPTGIAVNTLGTIFVAEYGNCDVRTIASGSVSTFAGPTGEIFCGNNDGPSDAARFNAPWGIAAASSGNIYVSDTGNGTIRKIAIDGNVTTIAGTPGVQGGVDGTNAAAQFRFPEGMAVDSAENIFVADQNNYVIRKVTTDGVVTTFAGLIRAFGSADGSNSTARFAFPTGVAVDRSNYVYVADSGNNNIRKITPDGVVTTMAGNAGAPGGSVDGTNSAARFRNPWSLVVDNDFNIFVTDRANYAIRKVTPDGTVTTFAGLMGATGFVDGVSTNARFGAVSGIAIDNRGNLYVCDNYPNYLIRKITPGAIVTTLGGAANNPFGIDNGAAANARFYLPFAITVDFSGALYICDAYNHAIRRAIPLSLQITAQPTTVTVSWPTGSGYLLEQCSAIGQTWSPVPDAPTTNGSVLTVSQSQTDQTYYRLRSP